MGRKSVLRRLKYKTPKAGLGAKHLDSRSPIGIGDKLRGSDISIDYSVAGFSMTN